MTTNTVLHRYFLGALIFLFGISAGVSAQNLNVHIAASSEVVGPGDRTTFVITVSNSGSFDLLGVSVQIQLPDHINTFGVPPNFDCGSSLCNANEIVSWSVGTLAPGQSRTVFYNPQISNNAPETTISTSVTASADNDTDETASLDIDIDPAPLLQLKLTSDRSPVAPGEILTYTIHYGNIGTTSPSNVVLTLPVPAGTKMVSISDDGEILEGTATWNLGLLPAGGGGEVRLAVKTDESLGQGSILPARATLDPGVTNEYNIHSSTVATINAPSSLLLNYGVSQAAVGPDESVIYTITASNKGAVDLLDVNATIQLPGSINTFNVPPDFECGNSLCNTDENVSWDIGALSAGESKTTFFRTNVRSSATPGALSSSILTAEASNAGQVMTAQTIQVDPTPLLRLRIASEPGPAEPGEPLTYTLTFGNVGSSSPSDVTLHAVIPEGTRFLNATGDATINDSLLTWDLGLFGAGFSDEVRMTVLPDAGLDDGSVIKAEAMIDANTATEYVVRSSNVMPVRTDSPLLLTYAVSQKAGGPGDPVTFTLTAANTGPADLLDVSARILLPASINTFGVPPGFDCGNSLCNSGEIVRWDIGNLSPGQSRSIAYRTFLRNQALAGEIPHSLMTAAASNARQVAASQSLQVDPTPLLQLSLSQDPGPVTPGEPVTYTLSFGNIGSNSPADAVLRMAIPGDTEFDAASHHGTVMDGVVSWNIPMLPTGSGGRVSLSLIPRADLPDGSLLTAHAWIDPQINNEVVVHSTAVTRLRAQSALDFSYATNINAVEAGEAVTFTISASNTGAINMLDVSARIILPGSINTFGIPEDFDCGSSLCNANEAVTWEIGTIAPGATESTSFTVEIRSQTELGTVLTSQLLAASTNTGSNQTQAWADILIGTLINWPPSPAALAMPENNASYLIGGGDGEPPVSPNFSFNVLWHPSSDPDSNPVMYTWQLSASADFDELLVEAQSNNTGLDTVYTTNYGALAQLLDNNAVGLSESITLYHRVMAYDGHYSVHSEPYSITLTRGTLVGIEKQPGLPTTYALHANYPNPFNPATTFAFDLPQPADVRLTIYDITGRSIATITDEKLPAGRFQYRWEAQNMASGVYIYRLEAGTYVETRKLTLLK